MLMLLLLPLGIALFGYLVSACKGDGYYIISLKEFLALVGVVVVFVVIGYLISVAGKMQDYEIWSGRIAKKQQEWTSCEHSYDCNPHDCNCDEEGDCDTCYDTCYEHTNDWNWALYTSNDEKILVSRVDEQGSYEPPRFARAFVGEPTAVAHSYRNYIKGNPWSILRREGSLEKFKDLIPSYPDRVYDYHYVDRFLNLSGVPQGDEGFWNRWLMQTNANLGAMKKVNLILVTVKTADSAYIHALEEGWLGGRKNDLVIILGVTEYPKISWVRVMSWTRVEELKIALRDGLQDIGSLEKRAEVAALITDKVRHLFVLTSMEEFKYLAAGVRPTGWVLIALLVAGSSVSIGLTIYFYRNDPFGTHGLYW